MKLPKGFVERFFLVQNNSTLLAKRLDNHLRMCDIWGASQILHYKGADIFTNDEESSSLRIEDFSPSFQRRYAMASDSIRKKVEAALKADDPKVAHRILKL